MKRRSSLFVFAVASLGPRIARAAPIAVREDDLLGRPLALVVALALVSLLPFVFMSVTSFVCSDPAVLGCSCAGKRSSAAG
jgi:hypothetical protein